MWDKFSSPYKIGGGCSNNCWDWIYLCVDLLSDNQANLLPHFIDKKTAY